MRSDKRWFEKFNFLKKLNFLLVVREPFSGKPIMDTDLVDAFTGTLPWFPGAVVGLARSGNALQRRTEFVPVQDYAFLAFFCKPPGDHFYRHADGNFLRLDICELCSH